MANCTQLFIQASRTLALYSSERPFCKVMLPREIPYLILEFPLLPADLLQLGPTHANDLIIH
jgi:hypothetical protein